ncbi:MAG: 50S ribosomal protein L35 [Actinomycetota bacterium]|nr:50S ribosomal protein L35 [Actinomycetota bacterium]
MPKMKTHRGAAKRLRRTGTGKLVRGKAFHSHILEKKSPKRKRNMTKLGLVSEANKKVMNRLLGGK